jgi:ribosomal protein L21E
LRELSPKPPKENEEKNKPDDDLPDKREGSDSEINIKEGLPPSTPATPANPVPATNKTPARTPAKLPQPSPSTPATKRHHKEFKVGDRVVIAEVGTMHQGQHGQVIHVGYGSRETDYIVKLDKESRGSKQVRVTVPKGSKLTFLMKL